MDIHIGVGIIYLSVSRCTCVWYVKHEYVCKNVTMAVSTPKHADRKVEEGRRRALDVYILKFVDMYSIAMTSCEDFRVVVTWSIEITKWYKIPLSLDKRMHFRVFQQQQPNSSSGGPVSNEVFTLRYINMLTHWGNMAAFLQTIFSNSCCGTKSVFWFQLDWNLCQICATYHYLNQWWCNSVVHICITRHIWVISD